MAIGSKSLRGSLASEDAVAATFQAFGAGRLALADAHLAAASVAAPAALAANPTPATADAVLFAVSAGVNEANTTSDDGIVKVGIDNGSTVGSGLARLFSGNANFHNLVDLALDVDHGKYFVVDTDFGRTNRILSGNLSDLASGTGPTLTQVFATDGEGESIANIEINTVTQKIYWIDGDLTGQFDGGFQLYSADYNGGNVRTIATITPDTNPDPIFGFAAAGSDFAIDRARGVAYVVSSVQNGDDGSIYQNHILRIDLASGAITFLDLGAGEDDGYHDGRLDPTLGAISAVDVDQTTGAVYFATQEGEAGSHGGVFRFAGGALTQLWQQPADDAYSTPQGFPTSLIQGIEFDEVTQRYYLTTAADANEYNASIFVGNASGGTPTLFQQVTAPTNGGSLFGMEIDHAASFSATAGTAFVEQGAATTVFAAASVAIADPENAMLKGATVAITGGFMSGDSLLVMAANGISAAYNGGSGILTLSGDATLANYQSLIQSITFSAQGDNPGGARTISVTLNDGLVTSDPYSVTLGVTAVNDAPVNSVPGSQTITEDSGALVFNAGNGRAITVGDADVGGGNLQVTLSVAHGTLTLGGTAGLTFATGDGTNDATVIFQGTAAAINTALNGLGYVQTPDYNGSDAISITTSDLGNSGTGGALTDTDTVAITIMPVADIANDSFDVYSGQAATLNVLANDTFENATVALSSNSAPQHGSFTVNGGDITYTADAGYSGADSFTYTVTSGGVSETATVTLNVIDVNDAPTATATAEDPTYVENADEVALFSNFAASTVESGQLFTQLKLTVTNVDSGHDALTIGGSQLLLSDGAQSTANGITASVALVGTTATVTFSSAGTSAAVLNALVNAMSYQYVGDAPSSADRVVTITSLTDNGGTANGGQDTAALNLVSTVHVTPVNDAPTSGDGMATMTEDGVYTFTAADFPFTDVDGNQPLNVIFDALPASGTLVYDDGALNFRIVVGALDYSMATSGFLKFVPGTDFNGQATIDFRVQDNGGIDDDGSDTSAAHTFTFTVTPDNDPPSIVVPPYSLDVNEDGSVVFSAATGNAMTVADVDSSTLSVTLSVDHGTLTFASSAGLTFTVGDGTGDATVTFSGTIGDVTAALNSGVTVTPTADYNGAVTLSAQASDGSLSGSSSATFEVSAVADIVDDGVTVIQGQATTLDLLSNDTFENADRAITGVTQGAHGTVAIDDNGTAGDLTDDSVVYTADPDFVGTDTFSYTVTSGGVTETATVTVTVDPANVAPTLTATGTDPAYVENAGTVALFGAVNASDDGTLIQLVLTVTNVESGHDVLVFGGGDLVLSDGATASAFGGTATVALSGTTATVTFDAPGGVTAIQLATLVGMLGYRYDGDAPVDTDRMVTIVSITDDSGKPNATTAPAIGSVVSVQPVDDAPVAVADSARTDADTSVSIAVLDNDTDVDGGPKSVVTVEGQALVAVGDVATLASSATVTLAADGSLTYDANGAYDYLVSAATAAAAHTTNAQATDSFTYGLNGGSTTTVTVTVDGVDGPDDRLIGSSGDDRIRYVGDPVRLEAGAGNDTLLIGPGLTLVAAPGSIRGFELIRVDGTASLDLSALKFNAGQLSSLSEAGESAHIVGTMGRDRIVGGAGADELSGGAGADQILISTTPTLVDGGAGKDVLVIQRDAKVVLTDGTFSGFEFIRVDDGASLDLSDVSHRVQTIRINSELGGGSEVLGTHQRDHIIGGAGDDVLTGGHSGDLLTGGAGADRFVYTSLRDFGDNSRELISDFETGKDRIDLSAIDPSRRVEGDQAFTFIGDDAFTGKGGADFEVRTAAAADGNLKVEIDINHDGVADYDFLVHAASLQAGDFIL